MEISGDYYELFGNKEKLTDGIKMEYDKRDNVTKVFSGNKVLARYAFDAMNKLAYSVNSRREVQKFEYDGLSRRVRQT